MIKILSKTPKLFILVVYLMSGEPMTYKTLNKINSRLNYLFRKKQFLTQILRCLLCKAFIQPHFHYGSTAWYPNCNKKLKNKIQTTHQNKCLRVSLKLDKLIYISQNEFERLNWIPISDRINQFILSTNFKVCQ